MTHHRIEVTVGLVHVLIDAPLHDDASHPGDIIVHVEEAAGHIRLGRLVVEAGLHDPDISEKHVVPTLLHLGGIAVVDVAPDGQAGRLPELLHLLLGEGDLVFPPLIDAVGFSFKRLERGDGGVRVLGLHY